MTDTFAEVAAALADRYKVTGEVGTGGMAVVFSARDLRDDRIVAIKVLREEYASRLTRTRFQKEIEVGAKLDHPNILPILDWGESGSLIYCTMPLVEGESLQTLLEREGQLAEDRAIEIVVQVADGLAYAHAHGVVHRDVKPSNILISGDRAFLADFGIARALELVGGGHITSSGVILGTPAYMSPEQAGAAKDVDARSDIYALACVLFHALAGEPPFTGRTPQAVIARHLLERVPSLDVVRADVSVPVSQAVTRAMSKSKADRFHTVEEFRDALLSEETFLPRHVRKRRWWVAGAAVLVASIGATVVATHPWPHAQDALQSYRVMGFPLGEHGARGGLSGIGEVVALGIGSALESAQPLLWIDGWRWLNPIEREDIRRLTPQRAEELTRAHRARYRIEGQVVVSGDSASVILTLFDERRGVEVDRRTVRGPATQDGIIVTGIRATVEMLPKLLEPGRRVDIAPLLHRNPAAVALLLLGDREYRSARFGSALDLYERALGQDSLLAQAALRAAPAASWLDRGAEAERLIGIALAQSGSLPGWQVAFAQGMQAYLMGRPGPAIAALHRALSTEPDWPDIRFALGEVYRHLLPDTVGPVALAAAAYRSALEVDPEFSPALFHLVEIALWRGDLEEARRYLDQFRAAGAQPDRLRQLSMMVECARAGPGDGGWADGSPAGTVLEASYSMLPAPALAGCAQGGFQRVMSTDSASFLQRWDALLGLESLLIRRGAFDSASAAIRKATESGMSQAYGLYVVGAIAGAPMDSAAQSFIDGWGTDYTKRTPTALWLQGQWAAYRGNRQSLADIVNVLSSKVKSTEGDPSTSPISDSDRRTRLFADAASATLAALEGDTTTAIARYERLRPSAQRANISWTIWESLGFERLAEAEDLLAVGRPREAERVAGTLDHPAPVIYQALRPRSLEVRIRAAEARNDPSEAAKYRRELEQIRPGGAGRTPEKENSP